MKNLISILAIVLFPALLLAQQTPLSALYSKYASEPGFETTEIMPGSTSYEWEKNIGAENIKEMIKDIESIRILEYKGEGHSAADKLWKKMSAAATEDAYIEVVNVSGDKEQARLYMLKESGGVYREIALIAREADEVTMITVTGNIDMNKIFSPETMQSLRELGNYYRKDKGECEVR